MCKSWNSNWMGWSSIISPLSSRFRRETEKLSYQILTWISKWKWAIEKIAQKRKIKFVSVVRLYMFFVSSCSSTSTSSNSSRIDGSFICCQNVKRKTGRKSIEVLGGLIQFEFNIVENQFNWRNSFSIFDQIRIHWNLVFNLLPKNDMNEMEFQCWLTTTISEKVSKIDQLNNQKPMLNNYHLDE